MHHPKQQDAERGQALAEFALTIPIFLMLVFGIIDMARLVAAFTQVIDAARQGVRYGIVEGLEADNRQYLDCAGIIKKARSTPGLIPGGDMDIDVVYRNAATGAQITTCKAGGLSKLPDDEVSLEVTVGGAIAPLTPVLALFDNSIDFKYTSERSIANRGAYYTDKWPVGPPIPQNFTAEVDCANNGRVEFKWDPMAAPERIEIRDSYTNKTVVVMEYPETSNASCNDYDPANRLPCGVNISPSGGNGLWYMVVIQDGLEGTSSNDASAACSNTGPGGPGGGIGGYVSITLYAFDDQNGNGKQNSGEGDFTLLTVEAWYAGPDGKEGGGDDVKLETLMTVNNGSVTFTDLPYAEGENSGTFYLKGVAPTGYDVSTNNPLIFKNMKDGTSNSGAMGVGPSIN